MLILCRLSVLLLLSTPLLAGPFPHRSVISTSEMNTPMMSIHTESYAAYSGNLKDSISAEWVTQRGPMGTTRKFTLSKQGFVYALDLDSQHCTKTDIRELMNVELDPEQAARQMKAQLNLRPVGDCEGAGLKGQKYSSDFGSMCFYQNVFLLWQEAMGTRTNVTKVEFDRELPADKIALPEGVNCIAGPDLKNGYPGSLPAPAAGQQSAMRSPQRPEDGAREDAMKQAQEAMKQLGNMFK